MEFHKLSAGLTLSRLRTIQLPKLYELETLVEADLLDKAYSEALTRRLPARVRATVKSLDNFSRYVSKELWRRDHNGYKPLELWFRRTATGGYRGKPGRSVETAGGLSTIRDVWRRHLRGESTTAIIRSKSPEGGMLPDVEKAVVRELRRRRQAILRMVGFRMGVTKSFRQHYKRCLECQRFRRDNVIRPDRARARLLRKAVTMRKKSPELSLEAALIRADSQPARR